MNDKILIIHIAIKYCFRKREIKRVIDWLILSRGVLTLHDTDKK